ncbi:MAG: hypothetical protein L6Q78_14500, partial [Bacteroidia bacterium]|nr:hypothetical protein [Bacteroidia bacterium]
MRNQYDSLSNAYTSNASPLPQYLNTFTYDANGNILHQLRQGAPGQLAMDNLTYEYETQNGAPTNRLRRVTDAVASGNYADDIDNQSDFTNYSYDEIGNLIADKAEQIASIEWTVYGKIQKISRNPGSSKPDLEFEYSPDGHRVVKIVKPKNGNQNLYTYYVRDAQGNVLATYERSFAKILDFQNISYAQINDTLVKYTGLSGLANFSAQVSNFQAVKDAYGTSLGSNSSFLQTFSSYQYLVDNPIRIDTLLNRMETLSLMELMIQHGGIDYAQLCQCLDNRYRSNPNYYPLMESMVSNEAELRKFLEGMEVSGQGQYLLSLAIELGFSGQDMEQSKEEIVTYVFGPGSTATNLKLMFDKLEYVKDGFKDCGTQSLELLTGLAQNNPNLLGELLGQIPEIKELFYKQSNYTCSITLSAEPMATLLATHLPEQTWAHLAGAYGVSSILTSFKNNYPGYFISQAVMYNKTILATTQQSQNLYGGIE